MEGGREKLIITVTANPSWLHPELKNYPVTPEEIADCAERCYKAGASIAHIHAPGKQRETIRRIRDKSDIIIQVGLSGEPLEARKPILEEKPDMMSIIVTHHDEQFAKEAFNILHTKPELEEYSRLCLKHGVKPEFEVWHLGAVWNLRYLEQRNLVRKPYFLSIFFGWPGGSWSPPTVEELRHRVKHLPEGSMYTTSVMDPAQLELLTMTIIMGGHVRVGTEDYPFAHDHEPAKDNSDLVAQIAALSRSLGRDVATAEEARRITGIPVSDRVPGSR
jgi:3-keto-5-aminohexanoate cleavage enzyme